MVYGEIHLLCDRSVDLLSQILYRISIKNTQACMDRLGNGETCFALKYRKMPFLGEMQMASCWSFTSLSAGRDGTEAPLSFRCALTCSPASQGPEPVILMLSSCAHAHTGLENAKHS